MPINPAARTSHRLARQCAASLTARGAAAAGSGPYSPSSWSPRSSSRDRRKAIPAGGAGDVVEDHEGAHRAADFARLEERIDHRQAVAEHVGQRDRGQLLAPAGDAAVGTALAGLDDAGLDVGVLAHHGVVEHGHVGHAAMAVTRIEIGAEHRILLGGRHRAALLADDVGVARDHLAEVAGGAELVGDHPDRDAGATLVAGGTVGDRLAATEAAMGQEVVEVTGALTYEVRKHLALVSARQIGAGGRRREVKLWGVARVLGQGTSWASKICISIALRKLPVNRSTRQVRSDSIAGPG